MQCGARRCHRNVGVQRSAASKEMVCCRAPPFQSLSGQTSKDILLSVAEYSNALRLHWSNVASVDIIHLFFAAIDTRVPRTTLIGHFAMCGKSVAPSRHSSAQQMWGAMQSESGTAMDELAEILRQNPDLRSFLEGMQPQVHAPRSTAPPPVSQ
jgi:hypothetical protein